MDRADAIRDIEVLAYEGFEALDAIGPYEVFRRGIHEGADLELRLVSHEPSRQVTARSGLVIEPDGSLTPAPDLLVVPGGGWSAGSDRGVDEEIRHGALPESIAECHAGGSAIASVCTGAFLVAAAGLLDGRRATTHVDARTDLADRGVEVIDARIVDEGDVLTASGVTAGIDLALHVLEAVASPELAQTVARGMEYTRQGPVVDGMAHR